MMGEGYIMDAIAKTIEEKILGEWHNEGYINGTYCDAVKCCIDGKNYIIKMEEVQ